MKLLKTYPHFSNEELLAVLNSQKEVRAFKDWQIIYSVQMNYGIKAEELSNILCVKTSKIYIDLNFIISTGFINENDLRQAFEAHGSVVSAKIITDRDTGRSKGFGFVEMEANDDAQNKQCFNDKY